MYLQEALIDYKVRDDFANQSPYRKAVLRKQFECGKNPYLEPVNRVSYTDNELKQRDLAAANWEKERQKYLASLKN